MYCTKTKHIITFDFVMLLRARGNAIPSNPGLSNSFSVVGHIYIPGFYTGQTLSKQNLSKQGYISVVPKLFLPAGAGNQLIKFRGKQPRKSIPTDGERHYLEITTSPGNDFRKSCDVARSGAHLRKNSHYFMAVFSLFWQKICISTQHFKKTRGTPANLPRHTV